MYSDDRLRELCGAPAESAGGLEVLHFWLEHLHPDDRERVLDHRDRMHDGRLERLSIEYRYRHPARGEIWFHHLAGAAERDGHRRALRTYGVLQDVTEQKRTEAALQDLSRRLIRAQEQERALLARELHDDLSQRLAVLAIDAGRAELAASGGQAEQPLRGLREGLVTLSADVHSLAYQLHPSILEELGLAEALRTECDRRRRQGPIDIVVSVDPLPADVGAETALCLFRVAQEALTNVLRHSGARSATVSLRPLDEGLLLAVRDDGAGFDPKGPRAGRSLGLASMRERIHLVKGTLDVESAPGEGTAIVAWVPSSSGN
ncbi:MAG: PAS domain-containing protein [Holophagales bacterium]|nr:PAS domain-containing protein [Holophagales bacterium]